MRFLTHLTLAIASYLCLSMSALVQNSLGARNAPNVDFEITPPAEIEDTWYISASIPSKTTEHWCMHLTDLLTDCKA